MIHNQITISRYISTDTTFYPMTCRMLKAALAIPYTPHFLRSASASPSLLIPDLRR